MAFKRKIELIIQGLNKKLKHPELTIEFKGELNDDNEPDVLTIYVYNLTPKTTKKLIRDNEIIVKAGYKEGDYGVFFTGIIENSYTSVQGTDYKTTIIVSNTNNNWKDMLINETYNPPTDNIKIITDIIGKFGLEVGEVDIPNKINYQNGKTLYGKLSTVLNGLIEESGGKLSLENGRINVVDPNYNYETQFILNSGTGLIGSPQFSAEEKYDYTAKSIFNYRYKPNAKVKIESKTVNGTFKIVKCKNSQEFETELYLKEV